MWSNRCTQQGGSIEVEDWLGNLKVDTRLNHLSHTQLTCFMELFKSVMVNMILRLGHELYCMCKSKGFVDNSLHD